MTNAFHLVSQVLTAPARPLAEVVPGIAPQVSDIVARALTKDRAGRFAAMDEIVGALEQILARHPRVASPLGASPDIALAPTEQDAAPPRSPVQSDAPPERASLAPPPGTPGLPDEPLSATLERWLAEGRVPAVRVTPGSRQGHWHAPATNRFGMTFSVHGTLGVLDLRASLTGGQDWIALGNVDPGREVTREIPFAFAAGDSLPLRRTLTLHYSTTFGAVFEDEFHLTLPREGTNVEIALARRALLNKRDFAIG